MKTLLVLLLLATSAFGVSTPYSRVPTDTAEAAWNLHMGSVGAQYQIGTVIRQGHTVAVGEWNVAEQNSGAHGSHVIGVTLPNKAVIRNVELDVITQPVSTGSAYIGLTAVSADDLYTLTSKPSTGAKIGIPVIQTVGTHVKTTASTPIYLVVSATQPVTAGKIKVFIDYVVSE